MRYFTVIEKHEAGENSFAKGSWHAIVDVRGKKYRVNLNQGPRVRIAYSSKWGYRWNGDVRDMDTGKLLWDGDVTKSTSIAWMLERAGLVPLRKSERAKIEKHLQYTISHQAEWLGRNPKPAKPGSVDAEVRERDARNIANLKAWLEHDAELLKEFA